VGSNAYAHASGIHQDGVLKEKATYEIINPETVGLMSNRIVLTARSGRHALSTRLIELGYTIAPEDLDEIYSKFLEIADNKGSVTDDDLRAICGGDGDGHQAHLIELVDMTVTSGHNTGASAVARLKMGDKIVGDAAIGTGPIDAVFKVIDRLTNNNVTLIDYSLRAVTSGTDAVGEAVVRVGSSHGTNVAGRGVHTDISRASALAYIDALNKLWSMEQLDYDIKEESTLTTEL
jgi:2-isopropylmalate synthase